MDKELQRIAIAEACGWKRDTTTPEEFEESRVRDIWVNPEGRRYIHGLNFPPDYLADLNACAEMEKAISRKRTRRDCYVQNLDLVMERDRGFSGDCLEGRFWFAGATASQRAEALLRTLNLWTPTGEENE